MPSVAAAAELEGALDACRRRLTDAGVALDRFQPDDVADDVRDLTIALGVERVDLRAFGDATLVLTEVIRRHPSRIRAALYVQPAAVSTAFGITRRAEDAWQQYIERCRDDAACGASADALDTRFDETLAELEQRPVLQPGAAGAGAGAPVEVLVDDARATLTVWVALQDPSAWPFIAQLLVQDPAAAVATYLTTFPTFLEPENLRDVLWRCEDRPLVAADMDAEVLIGGRWSSIVDVELPQRCALRVPMRVRHERLPTTQAPILVMVGELDPLSPPEEVASLFSSAPNAQIFTLPGRLYDASVWNSCVDEMRRSFLTDPFADLNADACAAMHQPATPLGP